MRSRSGGPSAGGLGLWTQAGTASASRSPGTRRTTAAGSAMLAWFEGTAGSIFTASERGVGRQQGGCFTPRSSDSFVACLRQQACGGAGGEQIAAKAGNEE